MKVLITGSEGFIGKNLCLYLSEFKEFDLLKVNRQTSDQKIDEYLSESDIVIHLAGVNRPINESDFELVNVNFTKKIIESLIQYNKKIPFLLTSSTQTELDNSYGKSKKLAEDVVYHYASTNGVFASILRLPGVFGKFCKPNYNSVVANFCYNIARGLDIQISDRKKEISLVYIDTVLKIIFDFIKSPFLSPPTALGSLSEIKPTYKITLGELADTIFSFHKTRKDLAMENVGNGFLRALYATYISYLPSSTWNYQIPKYSDSRGVFVEMLKTKDSGQFSYFTAPPGTTRGEHYHHSKTEKFLVIQGNALFRFKNKVNDEYLEIKVTGDHPTIVDTIPGWAHDITNIGSDEMIVMLWANEIFDSTSPDTYSSKLLP